MAVLVWISLQNISPDTEGGRGNFIFTVLQSASPFYLFLFFLFALISHGIRAERWKLLLGPLGYRTTFLNSFYSVMIGYFINVIIPRGGEISRCVNINRLDKIPVDKAFGTVVAERAVDMVILISFIGIAFLVELGKLVAFIESLNFDLSNSIYVIFKMGVIVFLVLIIIYIGYRLTLRMRKNKVLRIWVKLKQVFYGIKQGLLIVFRLERNRLFILYSLLIWLSYFLMSYFILQAFPDTSQLNYKAALTLFALGGIAMAAPLPGGTGSYHVIVPAGLVFLYGVAEDKATAFTFIFHGWQTLIYIGVGVLSLILSQLKTKSSKEIITN